MLLALLVDRDTDTRQMYAEYLRHSEWDIDEAEDGREALAKAITAHPQIVITETRLPGMSGLDLCRLLRTDSLTREIAIVVLTTDPVEHVEHAQNAGADVVLTKPCLPQRLDAEMRRLLDRSRELRARASTMEERVPTPLKKRSLRPRAHNHTAPPPFSPLILECPRCDQPLRYVKSHTGGVSVRDPEQWDYFECPAGCGTFQYRQRTRRLRLVV